MQLKTMYPAAVNSKATVTMGALDANTTTVTVLDGTVLPDVPNLLVLGTAKEGNVLTIERGFQGTPKAWNAGTEIARNFTGYDLDTVSENMEAVAEQAEETAHLVNGVQSYKSLSELSATASTDLLTIFAAMATPSRLVCDITNGSTAVYPAASGTLCINKTGADTGTASFIYEDGRVATAIFTANSSGGVTLTNWNCLTERVESMCNPNLLINTDFRNPVNQRGQDSYTGVGYGIDMWKVSDDTEAIVTVKPDCVNFTSSEMLKYKRFAQLAELTLEAGRTYTMSCLCNVLSYSGDAYFRPSDKNGGPIGANISKRITKTGLQVLQTTFTPATDFENVRTEFLVMNTTVDTLSVDMYAWKLELGAFSTLANEVVNYAAELRKCQRYLQVYAGEVGSAIKSSEMGAGWVSVIPLIEHMRVAPSITTTTFLTIRNKDIYKS